jgi:hypothetical protein
MGININEFRESQKILNKKMSEELENLIKKYGSVDKIPKKETKKWEENIRSGYTKKQ